MTKSLKLIFFLGVGCFFLANFECLAQTKSDINNKSAVKDKLVIKLLKLNSVYNKDLIDYMEVLKGENDFTVCSELLETIDHTVINLNYLILLMRLYEDMTCKNDKKNIGDAIAYEIKFYLQKLDLRITYVNTMSSSATKQNVIITAVRLKDELRAIRSLLSSY